MGQQNKIYKFFKLNLGTGILPFLPPFFLLPPRISGSRDGGSKSRENILVLPPFRAWRERNQACQEGDASPMSGCTSHCTSCRTQSELQMASGYLRGWSHILDKRNHSCYCQKKLSLYWIPYFFAHF